LAAASGRRRWPICWCCLDRGPGSFDVEDATTLSWSSAAVSECESSESLGVVSYLPSIVAMAVSVAVCDLFSVKVCDLGNWVRGRSRSLKMAPFDRPYATFYWSAIVTIPLSCTIFEFLPSNNIVTLKSGLEVTQCH